MAMNINIGQGKPDAMMKKITYYTLIGVLTILFILVLPIFLLGYFVNKILEFFEAI